MKKKILLTLTIISLIVVAFALSVSASNYSYFVDEFTFTSGGYSYYITTDSENTTLENDFAFVSVENSDYTCIGLLFENIENFDKYIKDKNITNRFELINAIRQSGDDGEINIDEEICPSIVYFVEAYSELVWNGYTSWLSIVNSKTYEDGLKDGVTDFLKSEEYFDALEDVKVLAVDEYKSSQLFKDRLALEKSLGVSEGKAEFIASDEYQILLDDEYDRGLKDGAAEDGGSVVGTTVTSILGVGVLLIVLLTVVNAISKKRKKR